MELRTRALMAVSLGHSEATNRVILEVEFDQHRRLITHHPAIMARLDDDYLGSLELHDAPIGKLHVNLAASEEADMCMHAVVCADNRFDVRRPPKSRRIDRPLNPRSTCLCDIQLHGTDFAVLRTGHGCEERIDGTHLIALQN